jgi:outer membrane receptor protein involved in Fe transport
LEFSSNQPSGDVAPVGLGAHTLYTGIYTTDTLDLTPRLSVTGGARYNIAQISLTDELGNDSGLDSNNTYAHFNPMIGATYKITPNLTLYGDYAVTNRPPTPLKLACSDPTRPCLIDNALVGDPPLQQVVTYTYEAGLRGQFDIAKGQANSSVGAFHALNTNDSCYRRLWLFGGPQLHFAYVSGSRHAQNAHRAAPGDQCRAHRFARQRLYGPLSNPCG